MPLVPSIGQNLQTFSSNGDVSIWGNKFSSGMKIPKQKTNKQTNKRKLAYTLFFMYDWNQQRQNGVSLCMLQHSCSKPVWAGWQTSTIIQRLYTSSCIRFLLPPKAGLSRTLPSNLTKHTSKIVNASQVQNMKTKMINRI